MVGDQQTSPAVCAVTVCCRLRRLEEFHGEVVEWVLIGIRFWVESCGWCRSSQWLWGERWGEQNGEQAKPFSWLTWNSRAWLLNMEHGYTEHVRRLHSVYPWVQILVIRVQVLGDSISLNLVLLVCYMVLIIWLVWVRIPTQELMPQTIPLDHFLN